MAEENPEFQSALRELDRELEVCFNLPELIMSSLRLHRVLFEQEGDITEKG
jgi:hypothetical protein